MFAWPIEGAAIPPVEGQGGAPLGWLLRCTNVEWEVLTASKYWACLLLQGQLPFIDYIEGAWLSDALSSHQERVEVVARNAAEAMVLLEDWSFL